MRKIFAISLFALLALAACNKNAQPDQYKGMTKIEFKELDEVIANPERGFYSSFDIEIDKDAPKASAIKSARNLKRTLYLMEVDLGDFIDRDITPEYLDKIQNAFDVMRENGAKVALRFAYSWGKDETPWDATVERTLAHVAQLKPLLKRNGDVIFVLQAGFVGVWGEWYYTQHFNQGPANDEQYEPRRKLLYALLDAMPENRQVEVRTPAFKKNILRLADYNDTLTAAEAFQNTPKARVAGHNDCFVANSDDYGTFHKKSERAFWAADSRYTIMGGETCNLDKSVSGCENAYKDLTSQHWTYLNIGYNKQVLTLWRTEGCFDKVEKNLGYRFVLEKGYFQDVAKPGEDFRVALVVRNDGFSAPLNPRGLELVWVSTTSGQKTVQPLDTDVRFWYGGQTHTLDVVVKAPAAAGEYKLCLNLPDGAESLKDNPLYSIRLANTGVWDEETGYNRLATITVDDAQ